MSKTRSLSALAAGLGILAAACWLVTATFPLAAAPQNVADFPGVTVDTGGSVLHRAAVLYPDAARAKNIQGVVVVEAVLDSAGNVTETRVLSGPAELRRAAQQSVLQWHFAMDNASNTRQVKINFQLPEGQSAPARVVSVPAPPPAETDPAKIAAAQEKMRALRSQINDQIAQLQATQDPAARQATAARLGEMQSNLSTLQRNLGPAALAGKRLAHINVMGVSDTVRQDLMSRLGVHIGDTLAADSYARISAIVHEFDEHMSVSQGFNSSTDEASITIFAAGGQVSVGSAVVNSATGAPSQVPTKSADGTKRITIGGNVQQAKLVSQPTPIYPPLAKQARIQGVVHLQTVIAKDGTVADLQVISGHPLLVPAALDAVRNWVYQQTLLNGEPVEVMTQIDVNFTLSDGGPVPPPPGGGKQ
jgi:TonB family protein